MAEKSLKTRIINKHDTAENFQKATNFTPKTAEIIIYDKDTDNSYPKIKIGDGELNINNLPFVGDDKADATDLTNHTEDTISHITAAERTKWNAKIDSSAISTHDSSTTAHDDIRTLITGLTTKLNTLADSDDTTLDQLSEIVTYIKNNKSLIDGITTSKVSVSDIIDNLTSSEAEKPLSAAQGKALKGLIETLQTAVNGKAASSHTHSAATTSAAGFMSKDDKSKLDGIATSANNYTHPITHAASIIVQDATHRFVSDTEKSTWNAKSDFLGSYADLTGAPTGLSSFSDDVGYVLETRTINSKALSANVTLAIVVTDDGSGNVTLSIG